MEGYILKIYVIIQYKTVFIPYTFRYIRDQGVEVGYNTSIAALGVVEGDEQETLFLKVSTGPPCHWGTYVHV
jgi:hypothetical protein